jgi:hypothetical protein
MRKKPLWELFKTIFAPWYFSKIDPLFYDDERWKKLKTAEVAHENNKVINLDNFHGSMNG